MDIGLLLIRSVVGFALAAHGAQKLFGLFGGYGIAGTAGFFETLGFRPGRLFALMAGAGEAVGGFAFALGLLTPFASTVMIATMVVAIVGVHREHGFFAQDGGYEYPLTVAATALGVACTGAGRVSLDGALGLRLAGTGWGVMALGLGLLGALPPLLARAVSVRGGSGSTTSAAPEAGTT